MRAASRLGLCGLAAVTAAAGCRPSAPTHPAPTGFRFTDATEEAGLRFQHVHGGFGKRLMPETVGSGCAWFDYDGDGWPDLYLVNCTALPGAPKGPPTYGKLFRNLGNGRFDDRTAGSGLEVSMYGQAAVAADYDADGDPDLLVTCLGANHLFRNEGGGRFRDVTREAGLAGSGPWDWHSGAAWLDYDRDGRLDLFVARYVKWTPQTDLFCGIPGGLKRYCPPWKYPEERCLLYRNAGGGRFTDVSRAAGVSGITGKWFQPIVGDYNADGWPDVVVTSDGTATALFRNAAGKRFEEVGAESGIAVSETGTPKAGMGIDAGDWRNSGAEALLIGNFAGERLSLFGPDAGGLYSDAAERAGLGSPSLHSLTFGLSFLDVDRDGWQDAFIGNGHIDDFIEKFESDVTYAERPLLFRNQQGQGFAEVGLQSGTAVQEKLVVRGCAVADYDRDGDPDVVVVQNNRPARLFRNDTPPAGGWLRVTLRAAKGTQPLGALVEVKGTVTQRRRCRAGGSFYSQGEAPLLFGLGPDRTVDVTVTWPGGARTVRPGVRAGSDLQLSPG